MKLSTRSLLFYLFLLLGLVPAGLFLANEWISINEQQNLLRRTYDRQINTILFSLNQNSWDIADEWFDRLANASQDDRFREESESLLRTAPSLRSIFRADRSAQSAPMQLIQRSDTIASRQVIEQDLAARTALFDSLATLAQSGYRKLEPVQIPSDRDTLFGLATQQENHITGILLDEDAFITGQLRPYIELAAADTFRLAVIKQGQTEPVMATSGFTTGSPSLTRDLWLFPNYTLAFSMEGSMVEELVNQRMIRSTVILGLATLLLAAGLVIAYRSVRRQMELAQLKSDFVANVSHELKTPLSLIRMFAETLEMDRVRDEERKAEYYTTIRKESERLTHLITNILNFSKMEAGEKSYQMAPFDLNELVQETLDRYKFHLERNGFEWETSLAEGELKTVADRDAISEAFLNLLDNAVKYSDETRQLFIATYAEGEEVVLEVTDSGIGIPGEQQNRIFDKFYRVSGTLVHESKGTGLGLNLVQQIMEAHNGSVTLKSKPGAGSTFRLRWPIKPEQRS